MDIAPSGDSIMVMCDKDIHPGCLLMYSYIACDGCRYSVYDKTSTCVKEQVFDAVPGDYTCGGGFVVDDNTSCITFSANTALSKSTDLLISEVITGVDSLEALVERLDTYKVKEQDYQDIINLYLDANSGSGGGGGIVKLPDDLVYSGGEDSGAEEALLDADTLGGKTEGQLRVARAANAANADNADKLGGKTEGMLHVAKAADADKLAGVDASQYMQKGDIDPNGVPVPKAGFIYPLATPEVPDGFLLCDGAAYNRADYPELFEAIGTYYGEGDGSTTFNVPNLQTRVPVGAGGDYALGDVGGEATHTLTIDEMPSHAHIAANFTSMVGWTGSSPSRSYLNNNNDGYVGSNNPTTKETGGGAAHNNMQPYTVVNYIIATGKGSNVNVRDVITGAQAVPLEVQYGGTGATTTDEAREKLGITPYNIGAISISKVWENDSPSSSFSAKTISLDLSDASMVMIAHKASTSGSTTNIDFCLVGTKKQLVGYANAGASSSTYLYTRVANVNTTGVVFDSGYSKTTSGTSASTDNAKLIPVAIYAVKGMQL